MSIKNENQERWNDPADQNEPTGIRVAEVTYALEKQGEKEVETTEIGTNVQRIIMGEVIVDQLREGVVFHTNEYKGKKARKEHEEIDR